MKKPFLAIVVVLVLSGFGAEAQPIRGGSLTFNVGDKRELITRSINKDLLLRVVREKSTGEETAGWDVWVVRKHFKENSSNLLYHSREWHGPYPSQAYAWHVSQKYFPNSRELYVRGYPFAVTIILVDPVVTSDGSNFVSGKIKISWKHR